MSETRYDWLADRWVIFAPRRNNRPDEFATAGQIEPSTPANNCPFCSGNEGLTPGAVFTLPPQRARKQRQSQPWLVRVVPNKYPALNRLQNVPGLPQSLSDLNAEFMQQPIEREADDNDTNSDESILFRRRTIRGAHEVIVESPDHVASMSSLDDRHTYFVFDAYRQRLNYWRAHNALHYAVIFKNVGYDAGASIYHTHSQLIAANFVPPDVLRSCQRMQQYHSIYDRGYFRDVLDHELEYGERIIARTRNFVVLSPFASHLPYTILILPKQASARFEEINDAMLNEFALLTRQVLRALESVLPGAAYNFVLHTSPFHDYWDNVFHWRMELFPRLTRVAGFEWGSDCFINPIIPEEAAVKLRNNIRELSPVS
jgi:UDPglucose--hexose-1-phosphate uridylyltransferase